jgi:hypothetical protein
MPLERRLKVPSIGFHLDYYRSKTCRPVARGGWGLTPRQGSNFCRVCFRNQPVDESVELGVQNELKLIFEHVYFHKIGLLSPDNERQ